MPSWSQNVYSKMVNAVAYDPDSRELLVTFNSGATHAYADVPEDVARKLANTGSVGDMMNSEIKGRYASRKVG